MRRRRFWTRLVVLYWKIHMRLNTKAHQRRFKSLWNDLNNPPWGPRNEADHQQDEVR